VSGTTQNSALRRGADRGGDVRAVGDSRKQAVDRAKGAATRMRFATDAPRFG
jgi:hypothetical protein